MTCCPFGMKILFHPAFLVLFCLAIVPLALQLQPAPITTTIGFRHRHITHLRWPLHADEV
jgi:hypothetical protein